MMMPTISEFMKGMDGDWEAVSITAIEGTSERVRVTYKSLLVPGLSWSHEPTVGELKVRVGMKGRIGFVQTR